MKYCNAQDCDRGPSMGTFCVRHWYESRGKVCPVNDPVKPAFMDAVRGAEAKALALRNVDAAADPVWKQNAKRAVLDLATERATFTADDVWLLLHTRGEEAPREPRALGAVMTAAASSGLIAVTTNYVESQRPEAHRRPIRVWRSLVVAAQV